MFLKCKKLHPDAVLPIFQFPGDAGADLVLVEGGVLRPGEARDFPVGLALEPPLGYWFLIHGRSSTLRKRGLFVNPGIIDNGYRGPLFVYVRNDNGHDVTVEPGDRLAQMLLLPYAQPVVVEVQELSESQRGEAGFGSTGLNTEQEKLPTWCVCGHLRRSHGCLDDGQWPGCYKEECPCELSDGCTAPEGPFAGGEPAGDTTEAVLAPWEAGLGKGGEL